MELNISRGKARRITGDLGLGYGRFDNLNFKSFTVRKSDPVYTRDAADYIEFAKRGGQLIVTKS